MYFELSVHLLVDLLQEAFHTPSPPRTQIATGPEAHDVSVVLFFCALREITLNWLIERLCSAQQVPRSTYKQLLAKSRTHWLRMNNLLPSLVGKQWQDLVAEEKLSSKLDYAELDRFVEKAVDARNKFMHEGAPWDIDRSLAEGCVEHIWPLLNFYVALHNRHVHPRHHARNAS